MKRPFLHRARSPRNIRQPESHHCRRDEHAACVDAILRAAIDSIIIIDAHGCIEMFNPAAERTFGYAAEEVIGQNVSLLMPEPHAPKHDRYVARYVETRTPHVMGTCVEVMARRKEGSTFPIELSVSEMELDDGIHFIGIIRDITERRKAEVRLQRMNAELERAYNAKNDFLARMSHELRTPMNAILGFGQLLNLDPTLGEKQRKRVLQILDAGEHLLDMIDEVLELSQIESGAFAVCIEDVRVAPLLDDVVQTIRPLAEASSLRLHVESSAPGDLIVRADHMRLREVLLTLLSNAVKYNCAGGTIAISCDAESNDRVRFVVIDTGVGIAEDQLDAIFQPFTRIDPDSASGTGVGLTIAKRLTEAMGGCLTVESQVGVGSRFEVHLPRASPAPYASWGAVVASHGILRAVR